MSIAYYSKEVFLLYFLEVIVIITPDELEAQKAEAIEILNNFVPLHIGKARLYFVDMSLNTLMRGFSDKVINYLNPGKPTGKFATGFRWRHKQVTEKDTTINYIEADFAVWKNKLLKETRERVAAVPMSDEAIDRLNTSVNNEIEAAKGHLQYILDNYNSLEVKITGFKHSISYPYIQYSTYKGKKKITVLQHLSTQIPNVLLYAPETYRSDMSIDTFIKAAKNPFGDVYYMHRE